MHRINHQHLLLLVLMLLVVSFGYIGWLLFSLSHTTAHQPLPETASVLGASTEEVASVTTTPQSCPDQEWVQQQILREVPNIYLDGMGKDNKIVPTSEILSCIKLPSCSSDAAVSCQTQKIIVDQSCVATTIQQKKLFSQTLTKMKDTLPNGSSATVVVRQEDYLLDFAKLSEVTAQLLETRLNYCSLTAGNFKNEKLLVPIPLQVDAPNTDGTVSKRYIEVDGSRQMLWMWQDGKVKRQFQTSGAFAEYNPVGIHTILNKSRLAWSSTAKKWMPYWMAFTYDKKQQTWFGLHALVYWYPGFEQTGDYAIKEPVSNLGKPRSTGCIRLSNDAAKYLFDHTEVGDILVVHD